MELLVLMKREYIERVRSRGYIAATIIGLLVIVGLSFVPAILDRIRLADKTHITVLEQSGQVTGYLDEGLQDTLPNGERQYILQMVLSDPSRWAAEKDILIEKLTAGETAAVLEVAPPEMPNGVVWHTKSIELRGTAGKVETLLQQMTVQERIGASGLSQSQLTEIFAPLPFEMKVEGAKAGSQEQQTQNIALVYVLLFLLYFSLFVYGMYVANGVVEEKSSRVMEMMIATVKPTTMMAAKILGIGAVGLTQYFIWIGAGLGLLSLKGRGVSMSGMSLEITTIDPMYLFYFGLFFVLGFLLYAAMYAGIGAMVSRPEDTSQAVSPMTFLIVIAFLVAMYSLVNPDNPWIVGLSYVPFFTPMVLFARIILSDVPPLSVGLGIAGLVLTIAVFIFIAGKMYRVGVLMYGKVTWRGMFRLLRER